MTDEYVLNFSENDTGGILMVWAKIPGYAPWPAFLQVPPKNAPPKPHEESENNPFRWVYFLDTHNYSWVECDKLESLTLKNLLEANPDKKSKNKSSWKRALNEALDFMEKKLTDRNLKFPIKPYVPKFKKDVNASGSSSYSEDPCETGPEKVKNQDDTNHEVMGHPAPKKSKKRNVNVDTSESKNKDGTATKRQNPSSSGSDIQNFIDRVLMPPPKKIRKHTLKSDQLAKTQQLDMVYGFMRLNFQACALIRNMLCAGHKINFWSVEPDDLMFYKTLEEFAENAQGTIELFKEFEDFITLTDVILMYTIDVQETLEAHKMLKLDQSDGNLLKGKSYVELTTMDYPYSLAFAMMFDKQGIRYLEVQLQGHTRDFVKGEAVVLACGNKALFNDMKSVFKSIDKKAFFLGAKFGKACQGNAIFQAFRGTLIAGYTEALAMANRLGIGPETFTQIAGHSDLDCAFLNDKNKFIIKDDYTKGVEEDIDRFQKDVRLGLELSNRFAMTVPMIAKAHDILKHARSMGYRHEDVACIYRTMT